MVTLTLEFKWQSSAQTISLDKEEYRQITMWFQIGARRTHKKMTANYQRKPSQGSPESALKNPSRSTSQQQDETKPVVDPVTALRNLSVLEAMMLQTGEHCS